MATVTLGDLRRIAAVHRAITYDPISHAATLSQFTSPDRAAAVVADRVAWVDQVLNHSAKAEAR